MLQPTFRQLQTFALIVETGSFSCAASRLGISPAAVSVQIRALETRLGCKLFDRRAGASPVLNERGSLLLQEATSLLGAAAKVGGLSSVLSDTPLTARVATDDYILDRLVRPRMFEFQRRLSDVQIQFLPLGSAPEAVQWVRSGRIDLAYLMLYSLKVDWPIEVIGTVSLQLFASPEHPIARSWRGDGEMELPVILPLAGSRLEMLMRKFLREAGFPNVRAAGHTQFGETMVDLAINGEGLCLVMADAVQHEVESGKLVQLHANLPYVYRAALRRQDALSAEHLRKVDEVLISLVRNGPAPLRAS